MGKFSVNFKNGVTNIFKGDNIMDALINAGYGGDIVDNIESWEEVWDGNTSNKDNIESWEEVCDGNTSNKSNVLMEGIVTWIPSQEGLISIKDVLDRNHYSIDIALNNILKEYIGKKVKIIVSEE